MRKEKMITVTIKIGNGPERKVEFLETQIAEIFGASYGKVELSTLKAGETFSTGKFEWVVLEQSGDTTAVLLKDCLKDYRRFDASSNNWITSELRKWLNNEFAKEIEQEIGEDNLVAHTPDLSTDDGSSEYATDGKKDKVSMLSCNAYRRYYGVIPKTDSRYWTLTPLSSEVWKSFVCCVGKDGIFSDDNCNNGNVVARPFCIFSSNILISKGE